MKSYTDRLASKMQEVSNGGGTPDGGLFIALALAMVADAIAGYNAGEDARQERNLAMGRESIDAADRRESLLRVAMEKQAEMVSGKGR